MKLTVIGIGQGLRGDDAAGIEAVSRWQQAYSATASRADVDVQLNKLPGLGLLDLLKGFDVAVLVDAVQSSARPGTIHRLAPEDLAAFTTASKSAHGWGVAETLELDRQLNPERPRIIIRLIGIEAEQMDLGRGLSKSVEKVMPEVCKAIEESVNGLLSTRAAP